MVIGTSHIIVEYVFIPFDTKLWLTYKINMKNLVGRVILRLRNPGFLDYGNPKFLL